MLYLLPNNSPLASQGFCWRPGSIGPYESLWSIFRKLAELNATTAAGVVELLKRGQVLSDDWKVRHKLDLVRCRSFDLSKLGRFLRLTSTQIIQACPLPYARDNEMDFLLSSELRYCAKCLRGGFHTALHQFLFLKYCPVHHNERLIEQCNVCNSGPTPYDMGSARARLGGAECCLRAYGREGKPPGKKAGEKLRRVAILLMNRCQTETIEQPIERWLGNRCPAMQRRQKLPQLVGYWREVFSSPAAMEENPSGTPSLSRSTSPLRHISIISASSRHTSAVASYDN